MTRRPKAGREGLNTGTTSTTVAVFLYPISFAFRVRTRTVYCTPRTSGEMEKSVAHVGGRRSACASSRQICSSRSIHVASCVCDRE
jgi:hypothetical protein